jgi:DNA-binding transcriptional ArsR family regulator
MAEENQTSKTNQTEKFPKPQGAFTISDLETLKVMTDPLRLKIIDLLLEQPRNVKFLASALNISSTKLYYHINMLEEKGILKVVSTRIVSGIIE